MKNPKSRRKAEGVDKKLPYETQGFHSFSQNVSFAASILEFFMLFLSFYKGILRESLNKSLLLAALKV